VHDGDAHLGLGGALLRFRDFAGAEAAWRAGAEACPWHQGLRREVTILECYSGAGAEQGQAEAGLNVGCTVLGGCAADAAAPPADAARHFQLTSHAVSRSRRACVTVAPVLSQSECAWLIAAAESHACAAGGWNTTRHAHAPTTDLEVHAIPGVLDWFNSACATRLFPLTAAAFPELGLRASSLRVSDAFLVRYDAGGGQV
jgi:hypothetical protein